MPDDATIDRANAFSWTDRDGDRGRLEAIDQVEGSGGAVACLTLTAREAEWQGDSVYIDRGTAQAVIVWLQAQLDEPPSPQAAQDAARSPHRTPPSRGRGRRGAA